MGNVDSNHHRLLLGQPPHSTFFQLKENHDEIKGRQERLRKAIPNDSSLPVLC